MRDESAGKNLASGRSERAKQTGKKTPGDTRLLPRHLSIVTDRDNAARRRRSERREAHRGVVLVGPSASMTK